MNDLHSFSSRHSSPDFLAKLYVCVCAFDDAPRKRQTARVQAIEGVISRCVLALASAGPAVAMPNDATALLGPIAAEALA